MIETGVQGLTRVWRWLRGLGSGSQGPGRLLDFDSEARRQAERFGPLNRRVLGVRTVEVSRILGSVGRSGEFNGNFLPRHMSRIEGIRFRRVLEAMKAGVQLPPIELYKLRRHYYVLDGHHRVGAARALGIQSLEGHVTLFIPSGDPEALRLFHERRSFEQQTGLELIGGARPSTYWRLLTEIHAFRREMTEAEGKELDFQFAARLWYARVFLPAFAAMRASNIQAQFPSLRHADMLACLFEEERIARRRQSQDPESAADVPDKAGLQPA